MYGKYTSLSINSRYSQNGFFLRNNNIYSNIQLVWALLSYRKNLPTPKNIAHGEKKEQAIQLAAL